MTVRGAARSTLLTGIVCLVCAASAAITIAVAAAQPSRRSPSHTARACHRTRHRRCSPKSAGKSSHRKHKPRTASKPAAPSNLTGGSGPAAPVSQTPSSATGSSPSPVNPAGGTPPGESPATPVAPARVEVTAEDTEGFRFVLSRPTVPAGKVIIEFVNHGQDEHNLNAVEPTEGSMAGSLPNTVPNAHPSLTVNLRPGSYTLFCSLPGHEAKGMKATLVVK